MRGAAVVYLRSRGLLIGALAGVALVVSAWLTPPPPRTPEGVATLLSDEAHGEVFADGFIWEPSGGIFSDFFWGRPVLFVAEVETSNRQLTTDVFRGWVTVTRGGQPLAVRHVKNLTSTAIGQESHLVVHGHHAAFATEAMDAVRAVTIVDLNGTAGEGLSWRQRFVNYLGAPDGLPRRVVTFDAPPKVIELELTDDLIVMALGEPASPAAMRLNNGEILVDGSRGYGPRAHEVMAIPDPMSIAHALADTMGGPHAAQVVARLESWAEESVESSRRVGPIDVNALGEVSPPFSASELPSLSWRRVSIADASAFSHADAFQTAEFQPDPDDTSVVVKLVAVDMRQLELRFAAAPRTPSVSVSAPGPGRWVVDRKPVATMWAAGTTDEAETGLGAMWEGRLLSPPAPGQSTVITRRTGTAAIGTWPNTPALPPALRDLRQGGDPLAALIEDAPSVRSERRLPRNGLCRTRSGQLVYGFGERIALTELGAAFHVADCVAAVAFDGRVPEVGMSLVMSPEAGAEARMRDPFGDASGPDISFPVPSPFEFFYVVERDSTPTSPLPGGAEWTKSPGAQPLPESVTAIYESAVKNLGAEVQIHSFSPSRFEYVLRAGKKERSHRTGGAFPIGIEKDRLEKTIATITIGNGRRKRTRGLAIGGSIGHRFRGKSGLLWVDGERIRVSVSEPGLAVEFGDASELPLTADNGEYEPDARVLGSRRPRVAACVHDDGRFLIAQAVFDSHEPTTKSLLEAGCRRIIALDRGTHEDADIRRAGTDTPPQSEDDATLLVISQGRMRGTVGALDE